MPTPQLDGVFGAVPVLEGRLVPFVGGGAAAALPLELDNGIIRLRFVAHAAHGVALEEQEDLAGDGFTWRCATGTADGKHDGSLWRIVTQAASGWSDGFSDGFGAGFRDTAPPAAVEVSTTADQDGRPAVMFRWAAVPLPTEGTVTVTVVVALGADDQVARWWISVARAGAEADGIEYVEFPRLAFVAPVATRSGLTHTESQVRARHLLPAFDRPALNGTNTPLSRWAGLELVTHHPSGAAGTTTQPMQFEALAAVDPQDTASLNRILFLATGDGEGHHKRFVRGGGAAGGEMVFRWAHRHVPPWARHPAVGNDDASRFGNVLYPPYPTLVGCLQAVSGAWWHTAAAFYRDHVAARVVPKRVDAKRTDLARGTPWIGAVRQTPNLDGATVGRIAVDWAEQHRELLRAPRIAAQVGALKPQIVRAVPAFPFDQTRGVNYLPLASTTSHCLHLSMDPLVGEPYADQSGGFWYEKHAEQEINALHTLLPGINAIRFWGSFGNWFLDPAQYLAGLRFYCRLLRARGMRMCFILFSVIPAGAASQGLGIHDLMVAAGYDPATFRSAMWTLCNIWNDNVAGPSYPLPANDTDFTHWPEPMTHAGWLAQGRFGQWKDTQLQELVGRYIRDIARFFAQDDDGKAVFHSYDLQNEVNLHFAPNETPNATLREYHLDFCGQMARAIRDIQPAAAITVGWAGNPTGLTTELQRHGCVIDYLSMHAYNYSIETPAAYEATWQIIEEAMVRARDEAASLGIPWALSEFFVLGENDGEMHRYLTPLAANGGGGFDWTPLRSNAYRKELTPGSGVRIFDGLWVCSTPAKLIRRDDLALQFDLEYPTDAAALQAWMLT